MLVLPVPLDEVIESRPAMVVNWRSSGLATADAIVSGSAPGRPAPTFSVGKSTLRQIADRQRAVRDDAEARCRHQQARRDRPPDEDLGDIHGLPFIIARAPPANCRRMQPPSDDERRRG